MLAPEVVSGAYESLSKDFSGEDRCILNMHRNLELYRLHIDAFSKNKAVSREAMQKAILERRFQ